MTIWRGFILVCALCALVLAGPRPATAQDNAAGEAEAEVETEAPGFRRPKPDLANLEQIRFLTDNDYPPFNYLDEEGALTGFNVDLARALCDVLAVECDVRSVDWSGLVPALENGETDAAIASLRVSESSLEKLDFTDAYYYTPARFVALKESPLSDPSPEKLANKKIAAAAGTSHEAYLRDFYPDAEIVLYDSLAQAKEALREAEVDILFGDGIGLMFWLNGTSSQNCCEFRGGPYVDSRYFGEGIGIAVKRGNRRLRTILDYGLEQLRADGRLEELYLRYFPLSFL